MPITYNGSKSINCMECSPNCNLQIVLVVSEQHSFMSKVATAIALASTLMLTTCCFLL